MTKLHTHAAYASVTQTAPDGVSLSLPVRRGVTIISCADSIDTMLPDGSYVHYGHDWGNCFYERAYPDDVHVDLRGPAAEEAIAAMRKRWPGRPL